MLKRALLMGFLISLAFFMVVAVVLVFAIPVGTDIFPEGTDFDSTRFHFESWLGRYILPAVAAVMTPVTWLPHDSSYHLLFWVAAVPYIFLLGVIVSFLLHVIVALIRHKSVNRTTDI
jgi:hypothetical protein